MTDVIADPDLQHLADAFTDANPPHDDEPTAAELEEAAAEGYVKTLVSVPLAVIVRREPILRETPVGRLPFPRHLAPTGQWRAFARLQDGDGTEVPTPYGILPVTVAVRDEHDHPLADVQFLKSFDFPEGVDELHIVGFGLREWELWLLPGRYVLLVLIDGKPVRRTPLRVARA